jgi:regulator of replication initiation timing
MTPLEGIAAAISAARGIAEVAKTVKNAELNEKVIDFQQRILDLQSQVAAMQDENQELRERNRELEKKKDIEDRMVYEESVYWERTESGERTGPFCPTCFDTKKQRVRLRPTAEAGFYRCNAHKGAFRTAEYKGTDDGEELGFDFGASSSAQR